MALTATQLFENELRQRGIEFSVDEDSGRHVVPVNGLDLKVSLENLSKEFNRDQEPERVSRFVETLLQSALEPSSWLQAKEHLFFCLEPTDYAEKPEIRLSISDQVDRVPVLFNKALGSIAWVTHSMMEAWGVSVNAVEQTAAENLSRALAGATVESQEIDGVKL